MEIKVTVLMPVYNTENYIAEAIASVLKQSFTDFELLIVNDGSTDKSIAIAKSFQDRRIVIVDQPKSGVAAALNTGLALAKGKYIARFDADDICYRDRLRQQYVFMEENPDYIVIGSDADYIDQDGEFLFYYGQLSHTSEEIRETIHVKCPFIHSTVFYRTSIARELGGYNLKAHTFEDYFLWTKFIEKGKVLNFNKPLIAVRLNPQSLTVDEKLRGKKFIDLKKEILQTKQISDKQERELVTILDKQNFNSFKQFGYYILLAKKYLWDNPQPQKARQNIYRALHHRPFSLIAYALLFLSWMPKAFVSRIYKTYKTSGLQG